MVLALAGLSTTTTFIRTLVPGGRIALEASAGKWGRDGVSVNAARTNGAVSRDLVADC